jgi:signal transduction histidine kinase/CheY-like chemotaxis protein
MASSTLDTMGASSPRSNRVKILLVDDTPENLISLEAALDTLGEELVLARSGTEALRHLLDNEFAAILLDVKMPDMDGFETAELIRNRPRSKQTPILFLTGYKNEEHLFRGYDLGAVDFLFKPIVPEVLRSKVAVFVELSRKADLLREQAQALVQQTKVLQKAELKFRSLLEAAPDAMVICREDGTIALVNSRTESLFLQSRDELLGRNIRDLVPAWNYELARTTDDEFAPSVFRTGGNEGQSPALLTAALPSPLILNPARSGEELIAVRSDGHTLPVEITVNAVQAEDGVLVTSSIRDITERRKAEEQIRELNAHLEERVLTRTEDLLRSNDELAQFAYVASHDLQEPLRTVSIYAQLLAKRYQGQLGDSADEFIGHITESAARMENLIRDLLEFSRLDSRGSDHFVKTSCDEALDNAINNLHVRIQETATQITRSELPYVIGDAVQLSRLFQNLLINSIKYRSDQIPEIDIRAEHHDTEWTFSIRDNGIGIEPQYAEKVFGIFRRLHPRGERSGNGMGLAICKKVVTRHGGRIWVESQLGQGATFRFTLPTIS